MLDENKTAGLLLFFLGIASGFIGVFLFFDKFFLCISNVFFLLGLYFLVGTTKIVRFFMNRKKIAGTASFLFGFCLIILRYGIYKLFFSFLPNIVNFVKYSPLSFILEIPGIKQLADYIMNNKRLPI
ncbi:Got1 domain containing protein [Plasmodium cynomolgi strain B]|uniref:Got1 domain containing protein n=1 Tax=Plasmodium cynomolgi (strain B) TaxID=1120755 RepID=K6V850_PLACD|nr:Got1 domain containing protein [Plasmodium cynomolgi strain B]GAB65317.1 Got1 domain containing protein [Plasmodium cynomolgi strain B]